MKRTALIVTILCFFQLSQAQKIQEISLIHETISLSDRKFYIDSVIDNRVDKSNIGSIQKGLFNARYSVQLKGGFTNSLQAFFDYSLPQEQNQIPITLKINKFQISELTRAADEYGFADIAVEYYHGNDLLFSNKQHIQVSSIEVTRLHEENIREAFSKSLTEFNQSEWLSKVEGKGAEVNTQEPTAIAATTTSPLYSTPTLREENSKHNTFTLGYQIGGYSMIGFDYEIRMLDYVGLHFGAGLSGYTYGLMIHTSPARNSPYFNVSFKDCGFGLLNAAGIEYGGKWVFNKRTGFGLLFQFGIVKILKIDSDFADILFQGKDTPPLMTSFGIGLSW
jgi:opacity protein-like surface antigen